MSEQLDKLLDELELGADPSPAVTTPVPSFDTDTLQWSRDVYAVYGMIGTRVTKASAQTPARFALWQYAKDNMKDFIGAMLPRAMTILDRANAKAPDADLVAVEEKRSLAELKKLLTAAVKESQPESL